MDDTRERTQTTLEAFYELLLAVPGLRDLVDAGGEAGPRIFPEVAPASTPMPYATHQWISGEGVAHLRGSSDLERERRQVTFWGNTALEAAQLAALLRDWVKDPLNVRGVYAGIPVRGLSLIPQGSGAEPAGDGSERHSYFVRIDCRVWYRR